MKVYTEEQVKVLINALNDIKNWDEDLEDEWEDCGYRAIDALSKFSEMDEIELPSDEEIEDKSFNKFTQSNARTCFEEGAKWMKSKILGNNHLGGITY